MKLKIIFLKKKYIFFILGAIIALLLLIFLLIPKETSEAVNVISDDETLKQDLTGDGIDDEIYIKINNNKYELNIKSESKNLIVSPDKKNSTLGEYHSFWPMRITFADVTRDKISEMSIQASENGRSVQHIFTFENNAFKDIFCSNDSILGITDSKNNKTPKIITGNKSNNKIDFSSHIFMKDKITDYASTYNDNFCGKNTAYTFINYVQSLPYGEEAIPSDIFGASISGKDMAITGKIALDKYILKFQDAFFTDTKWDSNGEISEINWTFNFKGTSINDSKISKNYSITIIMDKSNNKNDKYQYRISSIQN